MVPQSTRAENMVKNVAKALPVQLAVNVKLSGPVPPRVVSWYGYNLNLLDALG